MRSLSSRFNTSLAVAILVVCAQSPAWADMRVAISGGARILPLRFEPLDRPLRPVIPEAPVLRPTEPVLLTEPASQVVEPVLSKSVLPTKEPEPQAAAASLVWTRPMTERQLGAAEKASDLAPDLVDAILRIESIYDPTRVDAFGEAARLEVRAGTASMNNVFADRWHLADTDPNVHYSVRYLAQAWMRTQETPCSSFTKNRASDGGPTLSALSVGDCLRLTRLRADRDEAVTRMTIAGAPVAVPVFAAPLPGARLSSGDFWAAQKARIQAIQARLRDKWQGAGATGTTTAAR